MESSKYTINLEEHLPDAGIANVNGVTYTWSRFIKDGSAYHYEWRPIDDPTVLGTGYFSDMPSTLQENIKSLGYENFGITETRDNKEKGQRDGFYHTTDDNGNSLQVKIKLDEHLTDLGNAKRFINYHKNNVRHCHELKTWYIWDGKRWAADRTNKIFSLAKEVVATIHVEAGYVLNSKQEKRIEISKWANQSESEYRLKAMLSLAESEPEIAITVDALDANHWLLNCLNGTIDLRYNELLPHNRSDLITKLAPIEYNETATSETWNDFLTDVLPEPNLQEYVQRAAGYSITGDTSEETLFITYGKGSSGKSTFLEAIRSTLGDYAKTADFETFLQRSFAGGGPRNDIARLSSSRLVSSIEVEEGKRFAEGLVKNITGGDTIAARFLHKEFFEYIPQFKLWLAVNNRPQINEKDSGMWRRVQVIPFDVVIPEEKRDKSLKAKFRDPEICGSAIIAWLMQGCINWLSEGLNPPEKIKNAIKEYQSAMSPLGTFIEDECIINPSHDVVFNDLYTRYTWWCDYNDVKSDDRIKENMLTKVIKSLGFERKRSKRERKIKGLSLKDIKDKEEEQEQEDDSPDSQAAEVKVMWEIATSFKERPFDDIRAAICEEFLSKCPDDNAYSFYDELISRDNTFAALICELDMRDDYIKR